MDLQNDFFNELRDLRDSYRDVSLKLLGGFVIVSIGVRSSRECPYEIRCSYPLVPMKRNYINYRVKPLPLAKETEYLGSRFSWRGSSYIEYTLASVVEIFISLIEKQESAISLKTQMEIDSALFNFFSINDEWIHSEEAYRSFEDPGDDVALTPA